MKNLSKELTQKYLTNLLCFLKKYASFIILIVVLCLFGFLVYQIRSFATQEPSDNIVNEKMGQTRPINIDKDAVEKIQQLQSTNVEVKALFDKNRDNPFQE